MTGQILYSGYLQQFAQSKDRSAKQHFIAIVFVALIFGALLTLALAFRGTGWDGDSILSIAQFEKLIHPQLFDTPVGSLPKLLTIFLFGGFHWLTGSYDIHWITIVLTALAIAKLVYLPAEQGGGPIWLALPFLSLKWISTILSADNPPLQIAFLILGLVSLMERKPNRAAFLFLLAEFSRPGASLLIAGMIVISWSTWFLKTFGRLNLFFAGAVLLLSALHTAAGYRLGYATFDEFFSQQNTFPGSTFYDPLRYKDPMETLVTYFRFFFRSWWSLLPIKFTIPSIFGWALYLRKNPAGSSAAWILFFCPLAISPVAAVLTGSLYLEHAYLISAIIPFLAGLALLYNHLLDMIVSRSNVPKVLSAAVRFRNPIVIVLAIVVSVGDGLMLRDVFEVNPRAQEVSQKIPLTWISDQRTKALFQKTREQSGRRLVLLASCDINTLIVDASDALDKLIIFSEKFETSASNKAEIYLKDCNGDYFKKRQTDLLLSERKDVLSATDSDVVYTTEDMLGKLDWTVRFDKYALRKNRTILIKKFLAVGDPQYIQP